MTMWRRTVRFNLALAAVLGVNACVLRDSPAPRPDGPPLPPRPAALKIHDESLARTVRTRLDSVDRAAFAGLSVLAWNDAVLLTGAVVKPEQHRRAVALARESEASVYDDIRLVEADRIGDFAPDPGREQRLRERLGESDGQFAIRVVHGVAYLLGTARDADSAARAIDRAREEDGIVWVVSHLQIR